MLLRRALVTALSVFCLGCSHQAALAPDQGPTPDLDRDGVSDAADKCFGMVGDLSNSGCPKDVALSTATFQPDALIQLAQDLQKGPVVNDIGKRYEAGAKVLSEVERYFLEINTVYEGMIVEQGFNDAANLWSDEELRGGWDDLQHWGTVAGSLIAAGSLLFADGDSKDEWAAAGLGLVGVVNLAGNLLGPDSKQRVKEKAAFIAYTRAAYDDIHLRADLLRSYSVKNDSFVVRLQKFRTDEYEKADTDEKKQTALVGVDWYVDQLDNARDQIPHVVEFYDAMLDRYLDNDDLPAFTRAKLQQVKAQVARLKAAHDKLLRVIPLIPQLRESLLGLA